MTITLGSWIYPLVFTLLTLGAFLSIDRAPRGYSGIGDGIVGAFLLMIWAMSNLAAWLLWSLLR